jgi:hypothetical protein
MTSPPASPPSMLEQAPRKVEPLNPIVAAHESNREIWWLPLVVGALILGVGAWILAQAPDPRLVDSTDFHEALKLWLPLVHGRDETFLALKRFLNKVRYYAMLMWDVRDKEGRPKIPESILVGYGALEECCPKTLLPSAVLENEAEACGLAEEQKREAEKIRKYIYDPELKKYFDRVRQSYDTI